MVTLEVAPGLPVNIYDQVKVALDRLRRLSAQGRPPLGQLNSRRFNNVAPRQDVAARRTP